MPYLLGLFQCMELVLGAQSIGELSIIGKKMVLKYHNEKLGSCNDRFDLMSNTDHMPLLKQKLQSWSHSLKLEEELQDTLIQMKLTSCTHTLYNSDCVKYRHHGAWNWPKLEDHPIYRSLTLFEAGNASTQVMISPRFISWKWTLHKYSTQICWGLHLDSVVIFQVVYLTHSSLKSFKELIHVFSLWKLSGTT